MKKRIVRYVIGLVTGVLLWSPGQSQKIDEARMERDIKVAENVLSTMLKQRFEKRHLFSGVEGSYMPGYGVTFRLPAEMLGVLGMANEPVFLFRRGFSGPSFSWETSEDTEERPASDGVRMEIREFEDGQREEKREVIREIEMRSRDLESQGRALEEKGRALEEKAKALEETGKALEAQGRALEKQERIIEIRRRDGEPHQRDILEFREFEPGPGGRPGMAMQSGRTRDSLRQAANSKIVDAAKDFLVDYSDIITQLPAGERIVITNRGESPDARFGISPGSYLSIEVTRNDLLQYKQGKVSREQALAKIRVVNTESSNKAEPDLELLATILERLYREDLSKTYFTTGNIFFERLNDFGVVYYMNVFSAHNRGRHFDMPTLDLENLTPEQRDQKVKELYPAFEKSIKEDLLEYGRTLKSIKDSEVVSLHVKLTRCKACGIPSVLELTVKGSVLKEYGTGKISKESALSKISAKKGPDQ